MTTPNRIKFLDSHTGGQPTRCVWEGGPDLGRGPLSERVKILRTQHDAFRSAVVNEPRGTAGMVGALLVEPHSPGCQFGVIFFNALGYLDLSAHGVMGVVASLAHLGKIKPGPVRIDTPAGAIDAQRHASGDVSFDNVPSYRKEKELSLYLPGVGDVMCDLAWGGQWFCLVQDHDQKLERANLAQLIDYTSRLRQAVNDSGFPEVDHVALFSPSEQPGVNSRNFVLCTGHTYERSPGGSAVSAKLAALAADGKLAAGAEWVQESFIGSLLRAKFRKQGDKIIPTLTGASYVMAEGVLWQDPLDPFRSGIN